MRAISLFLRRVVQVGTSMQWRNILECLSTGSLKQTLQYRLGRIDRDVPLVLL